MIRLLLTLVLLAVAGLMAWVRLAPTDAERWHTDPFATPSPGEGGWKIAPGGDDAPPVFEASPEEVLAALDEIALATPRTERLAGSVESGRITYETRSRIMGFPDYTTVAAHAGQEGTEIAILARLRFGQGDMGVNRARAEDWLARLRESIDRGPGT
ncbi:DUF1499 domain-containing protein [Histidinibacterium aquaticum]|uniref:DUF1499 domain-containing protein n=1 Tax=Histidinibacterium aquaticum TaxID=2613962 RepID=A0A5J5GM61_9RHOB|nr:DUF1499 domain-containing protein [Histidinibacterium aquaticum]KAA9009381.1 DUF1499 domain-containing protein [Histidinibacterium aquaticum]